MLKTFLTAFGLVFLAELGDKTQLTTMLLVARDNSPLAVFLGAALALVATSFLGVAAGTLLNQFLPPSYLKIGSGVAFIVIGILLLADKF